jgi:hypothetical protein
MQELRRAESPARDCIGPAATPAGRGRRGQENTRHKPTGGQRRRLVVGRLVHRAPLLPHRRPAAAPDQRAPLPHRRPAPAAPDQGGGGLPAGAPAGVGGHGRGPQGCCLQAGEEVS